MRRDSKLKGKLEGAVTTYMEFNLTLQETVQRIAEKFNLSLEQSEKEIKKYWQ